MKSSKLSRKSASKISGTGVKNTAESFGVRRVKDGVEFRAYCPTAGTVQIAGDFNNWQPQQTPMRRLRDGVWKVKLLLSAGSYRYRLVVDGKWQHDPYNKATEPNPYGELNSVVRVS
jgi:1,4-alpha-glucan branching enzyme